MCTPFGFVFQRKTMGLAQEMAEARMRGMKLVVVDPICTQAVAKADEWVPVRPGTDVGFAPAMQHVLVNELALYDAPFMRRYANAPYLVGPDRLPGPRSRARQAVDLGRGGGSAVPVRRCADADGMPLEGEFAVHSIHPPRR